VFNITSGSNVTTLHVPNGYLLDLAWTRNGSVVFTAAFFATFANVPLFSEVVTMSLNGSVIARTVNELDKAIPFPLTFQGLSLSTDGAIYMTVANESRQSDIRTQHYVYESLDDGETWSVVFEIPADYHNWMSATKVSTDPQHIVFWTRAADYNSENYKPENYSVRVYTVSKPRNANFDNTNVTWHDINATSVIQNEKALIKLVYDGQSNVFTSNSRDVYAWSASDESELLLLDSSVDNTLNNPMGSVSVDRQRNVLYAGRYNGSVISVFNLTYT
jgi:hypothetical protein